MIKLSSGIRNNSRSHAAVGSAALGPGTGLTLPTISRMDLSKLRLGVMIQEKGTASFPN